MSKLPPGTTDLYDNLGITPQPEEKEITHSERVEFELPTGQEPEQVIKVDVVKDDHSFVEHEEGSNIYTVHASSLKSAKFLKTAFPYIVIFIVGLFFFMLVFGGLSLTSLFSSIKDNTATNEKVETPASQLSSAERAAYNKWISAYFFDVNDPKIVDPNSDISGNGLTNYQKYLLNLNPKVKDTMGLGMTDTEALMQGINPLTGGPITDLQKKIIENYIDLEAISNKISLAASQSASQVAGIRTAAADTFRQESVIDQSKAATLNIPSLNITVPIIWTQDTKSFTEDLRKGVVHYPGTAMPGEIGTAYISGHSSNYAWESGNYNNIFATLGNLKKYESFTITATDVDGKPVTFNYVVAASEVYKADDQKQFMNIGKSTVALSTCWPIGTTAKRLVVFGHLSQVSK